MTMYRVKDEKGLEKVGLALDPNDPNKAVLMKRLDGQHCPTATDIEKSVADSAVAVPFDAIPPTVKGRFTNETSSEAIDDLSTLDEDTLLTGLEKTWKEITALDSKYPEKYHRLGEYCLEVRRRYPGDGLKDILQKKGINKTKAWRAEQIAKQYTREKAAAFPTLRAILAELPSKQPRQKKAQIIPKAGSVQPPSAPPEPDAAPQPTTGENILDMFVQLGIEIRETLGEDALDDAVGQIRNHIPLAARTTGPATSPQDEAPAGEIVVDTREDEYVECDG
jgi:hypothetical protein